MSKANVLLVSSSGPLRWLVQNTLVTEGYDVDVTYKGINGLTLALLKPLDLFLVDQSIADMHNDDLIRRIRNHQKLTHIPVLALTDIINQEKCQQYVRAGAKGCLYKPFTGSQLLQLVRQYTQPQQVV